jgi:hypothetical protein
MYIDKLIAIAIAAASVTGCASQLTSFEPVDGQSVVYTQGVGAITTTVPEAVVTIYPTFQYQSPNDIPTFTLMVQNTTDHDIEFNPAQMNAGLDTRQCHIYSMQERVSEIRSAAKRKQIALAIAGGLAAGAAAYGASHTTTTYNGYGYVGNRSFYTSGTINTYDPAAGIFAGAVVGSATGVGIHQISRAAGYQEQAAQGIFQRTTIHPGSTVIGQILLKNTGSHTFSAVNLDVPVDGAWSQSAFVRKDTL